MTTVYIPHELCHGSGQLITPGLVTSYSISPAEIERDCICENGLIATCPACLVPWDNHGDECDDLDLEKAP